MPQCVGRLAIVLVVMTPWAWVTGQRGTVPPAIRYLGQAPPGTTPVRFAPGIVSTDAIEINAVFRHDRDDRWTTAETVPAPVSTESSEAYPTVAGDGSLYFSSNRPGGFGGSDIYRAPRLADGSFGPPVNVGSPPNSSEGEGDTYVSPDQTYLIFSARRAGGFGRSDLYVSFRAADATWGPAINLGPAINTADTDFCPMVTPDGRYLFFSRAYGGGDWNTTTDADVFWVDMAVVDRLR
jgi:hypothetical protein